MDEPRASFSPVKGNLKVFAQPQHIPDRSGVHIQGIAGRTESTLHPYQGSRSAHS